MNDHDLFNSIKSEFKREAIEPAWTYNEYFEKNGFFVIKNIYDTKKLSHPIPEKKGKYHYWGNEDEFHYEEIEDQVIGSTARYWHPQYRKSHSEIRKIIEMGIGRKLYNTYYYDRFYFAGQELVKHVDRPACEISVSVHIGTNLNEKWPIFVENPKGKSFSIDLEEGDGLVYKGCHRPHWREKMPGESSDLYYHQIFYHYVLQDGHRAHFAFDR